MESTTHVTDVQDSDSEIDPNETPSASWEQCKSVAIKGSEALRTKKHVLSEMQKTEYFTTEIVGDVSTYSLDTFPDERIELGYFISGRFFLDTLTCSYRSFANDEYAFTLRTRDEEEDVWEAVNVIGGKTFLRMLSCSTVSLVDQPSSWEVLTTNGRLVKLRFIPRRLTIGCLVETKSNDKLFEVQAIHTDEVLLLKGSGEEKSSGLRRGKLNKSTLLLPKKSVFPYVTLQNSSNNPRIQKLFEDAMTSSSPSFRLEAAKGLLFGHFERRLPKAPELGIQVLEKVLSDGENGVWHNLICAWACRYLASYYSSVGALNLQEKYLQQAVEMFGCSSSAYNLAILVEKNERYREASHWYQQAIILSPSGCPHAQVALAEYAMAGHVGAPNYARCFEMVRNLDDQSALLLLLFLIDRNPLLDTKERLLDRFSFDPAVRKISTLHSLDFHLVKVLIICQVIEGRLCPAVLTLSSMLDIWRKNHDSGMSLRKAKKTVESSGYKLEGKDRCYLNLDNLIFQCTQKEMRPQIYLDFLHTNEKLARKEKNPTAIVFEVVCSLYGLLGCSINIQRVIFFLEQVDVENIALSLLRNYIKSIRKILRQLPFTVVDLVLEYVFSILMRNSINWPANETTRDFCVAISSGVTEDFSGSPEEP